MSGITIPNTVQIKDIGDITHQLRVLLKEDQNPERIGKLLLDAIGVGDTFTSKALRVLSGRLPFSGSSNMDNSVRLHIRELIEGKKQNPDTSNLMNLLAKTGFVWDDMRKLMRTWSTEALISINNFIYDSVISGADLNINAKKYVDILNCVSNQLTYREIIMAPLEGTPVKEFFGAGLHDANRNRIPDVHKVYKIGIQSKNYA